MSDLIRYVELGDTTNLPRWLNVAHFEKFELGASNGKLYVIAHRARAVGAFGETIGRTVFLTAPNPAEQTGFGPWAWWDRIAGVLEVEEP